MVSRGNFGNYNAMVSLGHWKVPLESVSPRRLRVGLESILSHWAKKTKSERRGILFWGITPPLEIITLFQTSVFISLFGPKRETPVSDWNSLKKNLLHLFLGRNGGTYTRGGGDWIIPWDKNSNTHIMIPLKTPYGRRMTAHQRTNRFQLWICYLTQMKSTTNRRNIN